MNSKIHFLVRGFAVAAIILLHAGGSHANVDPSETADDHTPIQRSYTDGAHLLSSEVINEHWGMVKTKGSQFVVGDRPFYFNGFNTYWLMMHAVDPSTRGKVTQVFRQAVAVGLTVCQTWAFNDGGHMHGAPEGTLRLRRERLQGVGFRLEPGKEVQNQVDIVTCEQLGRLRWQGAVRTMGDAGVKVTFKDDFFSDQTVKG
ncbi:hypothetical protein SETIT_3G288300v2 [Setaria italica]|uniref:Uncharacterized protein n=1 Tax=Setaria italica TaxID=4555 RepID=A0A368QJY1_SETIT|nr:hypothetical protein SETIT_3G288300v2 [Setaria italica]